jgi:hypothetical protein
VYDGPSVKLLPSMTTLVIGRALRPTAHGVEYIKMGGEERMEQDVQDMACY